VERRDQALAAKRRGDRQGGQAYCALAQISALEASQTTWMPKHALGEAAAIAHLRQIDDEIAVLEGSL
jgi:hypothetical protein